jgi:hypothetical protein
MSELADDTTPFALADESATGPFVTGGVLRLPASNVDGAVAALREIKRRRGIAADAKIHCRILFAGNARLKSPFKRLSWQECHVMLSECVDAMLQLDGSWWGSWADRDFYPSELQLVQGERFTVTSKHLAGICVFTALVNMSHFMGAEYRLAFDPDPTKIDWGLVNRTQATHFARTHPQATNLVGDRRSLLDMADIGSYTLAQSLLVSYAPPTLKPSHMPFPDLLKRMQMRSCQFAYPPELLRR